MTSRRQAQLGVVLLEVLVAITIFAVSAAVILETVGTSLMGLRRAEQRLAMVEFAADCLGQQRSASGAQGRCSSDFEAGPLRGRVRQTVITYAPNADARTRSVLARAQVEISAEGDVGPALYALDAYFIARAQITPREAP